MARQLDRKDTIAWRRCRGMNNWDSPDDLPDDFVTVAANIQLEQGGLGKKRNGTVYQPITFTTPPTGYLYLATFTPAGGDPVAQLFIVGAGALDTLAFIVRTGTTAISVGFDDTTTATVFHTAQLNNKLFVAYHATSNHKNRLHVLEADGTVLRRTGLLLPNAPLVTNTAAAGTYPATARFYRVQWRVLDPVTGTIQILSNLGPSTAFTPSGVNSGVDIARPPLIGGIITHWAVYVSQDNATYYHLATLPIATTVYTDTATVGTWTGELAPLEGTYTNWPSVRFLCSTGDRLLGFGAYEADDPAYVENPDENAMVPFAGRVYFSPVINTTDADDEERVSNTIQNKGWIDIARNAGGEDRGIAQAVDNQIMVAQSEGLYLLIPTGQDTSPYRRVSLSPTLGWVSQWSTFAGEDEQGRPVLYFVDPFRGPYRYGARGLEWLGYDIQKTWERFDKDAPPERCHGVYIPATRECRWWVPVVDPIGIVVLNFNVRSASPSDHGDVTGGWTQWLGRQSGTAGPLSQAHTSVLFSEVFTNPRSAVMRAYLGFLDVGLGAPLLLRMDEPGVYVDGQGTAIAQPYAAYLVSKAWLVPPDQNIKQIIRAWVKAAAGQDVVIMMGTYRNYGDELRLASVTLTPTPVVNPLAPYAPFQQARVQKRFANASMTDAFAFQIALGDPGLADAATTAPVQGWTLDQWFATLEYGDET